MRRFPKNRLKKIKDKKRGENFFSPLTFNFALTSAQFLIESDSGAGAFMFEQH
jgi:hypothetical protein